MPAHNSTQNPRTLLEIVEPHHAINATRSIIPSVQSLRSLSPTPSATKKCKTRTGLKNKQPVLENASQVEGTMVSKKRKKPVHCGRDVVNLADEGVSGRLPNEHDNYGRQSKSGRVVVCHICAMTLTSNAKLKVHILRHTGERPFR